MDNSIETASADSTMEIMEEVETTTVTELGEAQTRLHGFQELIRLRYELSTSERNRLVKQIVDVKNKSSELTTQLRVLKQRHITAIREKQSLQDMLATAEASLNDVVQQYESDSSWKPPAVTFIPEEINDLKIRVAMLRRQVEMKRDELTKQHGDEP